MDKLIYDSFLDILREELVPAGHAGLHARKDHPHRQRQHHQER